MSGNGTALRGSSDTLLSGYCRMLNSFLIDLTKLHINELYFSVVRKYSVFLSGSDVCEQIKTQVFSSQCVYRFRLRKKTWKNPGTVFLDYHIYEEDINISSNWEVFLEILDGNDTVSRER